MSKDDNENLKWAEYFFDSHQQSGESPSCDANVLAAWYANRSYTMENRSGQLSNALELCILGLDLFDCAGLDYNSFAEKAYDEFSVDSSDSDDGYYLTSQPLPKSDGGFKNLAEAYVKLSSLEKLVYDTTSLALETSLSTVTLKHWLNIPNVNKLELILRGTTPDQTVGRIKDTIFCWMGLRKQEAVSDCERRWVDVLVRYMKKIANNTDGFKTCVAIIKSCNLMETKHAIIREPTTLIETCLSCIYSCPFPLPDDDALLDGINNELFNGMNDIFNMVPVVTKSMVKDYPEIIELDKSVDRLKCHLDALEILHGYKLAPSMKFFSAFETAISSSGNEGREYTIYLEQGKEILENICRKFIANQQYSSTQDSIAKLRDDLEYVRIAISGISEEDMNEMLLKHSLGSRFYNVGKIIIEKNILSPDAVERIILSAAIEYYNSAAGSYDQTIDTAKEILNLAPVLNDDVLRELHLIEAARLVSSLGSTMLPLQIRLAEDKMDVIKRVLQDNPNNYLNIATIQKLMFLLDSHASLSSTKRMQMLLIKTAVNEGDFSVAANYFLSLFQMIRDSNDSVERKSASNIADNFGSEYLDESIVMDALELVRNKNFTNLTVKKSLVDGLLINCPPEKLEEIVQIWCEFDYDLVKKCDVNEINSANDLFSHCQDDFEITKRWYSNEKSRIQEK